MTELGQELIRGAYDLHVHTGPDAAARRYTDLETAHLCRDAGMAGFVSKCHQSDSSARAAVAMEACPGITVWGGVVLNNAVGGLNPAAVTASGRLGGRLVWFPTVDAKNDVDFRKKRAGTNGIILGQANCLSARSKPIRILSARGDLNAAVCPVLEQIRDQDMVLVTGHISPQESLAVLRLGQKMGLKRMIVNHVNLPTTWADLELQREMLATGALLEHCWYNVYYGLCSADCSVDYMLESIRQAGPEHILLTTDFGQPNSPSPAEGLAAFAEALYKAGISRRDLHIMLTENPERVIPK